MTQHFRFAPDFVWGAATAAPQIEGSPTADGKGLSIWDHWSAQPGATINGDTPDPACDHYHRWREDFQLLRLYGFSHYRMSVAWPRIVPDGDGSLNQKGLDFYSRQIDHLLELGITPWVTLFHWDLPQALEEKGGWRSRSTVDAFARYVDIVVTALGDRVRHWFTVNEVSCFTEQGYGSGIKAPGRRDPTHVVNQTVHHGILAHGHGVRAVREHGAKGSVVGLVDAPKGAIPTTSQSTDVKAARRWFADANDHILGAVMNGRYSDAVLQRMGADAPLMQPGDFDLIAAETDFLGVNIYTAHWICAGQDGEPRRIATPPHYPAASCDWLRLTPEAMYWTPKLASEVYRAKRILITENGFGYEDELDSEGRVQDLARRMALKTYLSELARGIRDGNPVRGYFAWSLMDNYEWQEGYSKRFGLTHIDYKTQKRTPKMSTSWLCRLIQGEEPL